MTTTATSPEQQLDGFIAKYTPEIQTQAHAILAKMRELLPGAVELVYDNYNALAIGFSPTERTSEAVVSIALYPRWVNLFFLQGADLPDPQGILQGDGAVVRRVLLKGADTLDSPAIQELIALAVLRGARPFDETQPGRMVIRSISAKQRPRRPEP